MMWLLLPAQLAVYLADLTGATGSLRVLWPRVAPLCIGTPAHCVLAPPSVGNHTALAVVDLRRVLCPPTAPFITVEVSPVINFPSLIQGLAQLAPRHRPVTAAYLNEELLGAQNTYCGTVCVITLLSHWQTRGGRGLSATALFDNTAVSAFRTSNGYLADQGLPDQIPAMPPTTTTSTPPPSWNIWEDFEADYGPPTQGRPAAPSRDYPVPHGPPISLGPIPPSASASQVPLALQTRPAVVESPTATDPAAVPHVSGHVFRPWSAWEEAEEEAPALSVAGQDGRRHGISKADAWDGVSEWAVDGDTVAGAMADSSYPAIGQDLFTGGAPAVDTPSLPMGWPTDMQFALHCNDLCTLDPRFFANSFTLFDYAMQVRILPRPREAGEIQLRDLARSYSRHMRPPINIHRLMDELPGFPSPQFSATAHEVPRQAFAIPIDLRPSGWGVCVGLARIGASLFTFASDSLHVCAEPALHQKLARGDSIGSSKGADIDPFAPLSPAVDYVRVCRILNPFMLGATADVTAPPAVPPVEEAQLVAEHLEQDGLLRVAAHAAGCPTVHLVIDPAVSPTEFARLVSRAFAAVRPHSSLQLCWPQLHPYSPDAILHVIADLDHRRGRSDTVFLVDGRGLEVAGQGFRTFVAPSTLTAVELLAHVAACMPCRHHPAHVLVNNVLLGHTDPRTYHCPLIRLVSRQQCDRYDRQRRTIEPAVLTTHSILQRMPAFRALSDTFEGFLQRAVVVFSIAGHVASTTTTTSTMPCSVRRGVTSTTTTFVANAATISHPCDPLDLAPISFHLASHRGDLLTMQVRSRGDLCELLYKFCRSLWRHGCLSAGDSFEASPRVYFSDSGVHVLTHNGMTHPDLSNVGVVGSHARSFFGWRTSLNSLTARWLCVEAFGKVPSAPATAMWWLSPLPRTLSAVRLFSCSCTVFQTYRPFFFVCTALGQKLPQTTPDIRCFGGQLLPIASHC